MGSSHAAFFLDIDLGEDAETLGFQCFGRAGDGFVEAAFSVLLK
jgi:hypothetical protein